MAIQTEPVQTDIEIRLDNQSSQQASNDVQKFARDTQKELNQNTLFELELNRANLQQQLSDARAQLRLFKKQGDADATIQAQLNVNRLADQTREAGRQLLNYRNTGDRNLSRLQAKFDDVTGVIGAQGDALRAAFSGDVIGAVGSLTTSFNTAGVAARGLLLALGPITIALGAIVTAFSVLGPIGRSFESAFAGVQKTLDGTTEQFATLRGEIEQLTRELPLTFEELSKIAEIGGQLGVPIDNVSQFTEVVAGLGIATGLSAETVAQSFARIASVTGTPLTQIDQLGAALTDLGNNFAANEGPILELTSRIAGAGSIAGLTAQELLGVSAAVIQVGLTAEAGGTSISKAFIDINTAVNQGGESLDRIAATAGLTASQFRQAFEEDASDAFLSFVQGLERQGDGAVNTIDELFGSSSQLRRTFLGLASDSTILADAIGTANNAFDVNTALTDEVNKRLETNDSRLQILANRWRATGASIGDTVNNIIVPVLEVLTDFFLVRIPISIERVSAVFNGFFQAARLGLSNLGIGFANVINGISRTATSFINGAIDLVNSFISQLARIPGASDLLGDLQISQVTAPEIDTSGLRDSANNARNELSSIASGYTEAVARIRGANQQVEDELRSEIQAETLAGIQGGLEGVSDGYENLGSSASGSTGRVRDALQEQEKLLQEQQEKEQEILDEKVDAYEDAYDELTDTVEDNIKDLDKEIEKTAGSISKINDAISDINADAVSDLTSRFLDVNDEIADLQSQEGVLSTEDRERLRQLEEERKLIEANTTEEERQEAVRVDGLSDTEKILEARETELAQQEELRKAEEERLALLQQRRSEQEAIIRAQEALAINTERNITAATIGEIDRRIDAYRRLQAVASGGSVTNNTTNNNVNITNNIQNSTDANIVANSILSQIP